MLDIKFIRQNPEVLDKAMRRRGADDISATLITLDTEHRQALTELQTLQTERNTLAKQFGEAKRSGQDTTSLSKRSDEIKELFSTLEERAAFLSEQLHERMALIPNILADDTPDGRDESQNVEVRRFGAPPAFSFTPKPHYEIGEALGMMDFETASKLSGSRFVVLSGDLCRLERALGAFMIDVHTQEFGYEEISPPLLVHDKTMYGIGQLPKFKEDMFVTTNGHWLISTAEVVLTNLVAEEILSVADLPRRYTAFTPCFRSEAGAAGRDTRGMIRQHQFSKVELVSIVHPEDSVQEHERMTKAAETILQRLGLAYRVMALCGGDTGFCARKTYDLEVWLPSQETYREISSCSNCGDFQARRMNARFRLPATAENPKPGTEFVHTLNGSGLAVGRTMVAILENYQQEDGSVIVPDVLVPYMRGIEIIAKK